VISSTTYHLIFSIPVLCTIDSANIIPSEIRVVSFAVHNPKRKHPRVWVGRGINQRDLTQETTTAVLVRYVQEAELPKVFQKSFGTSSLGLTGQS